MTLELTERPSRWTVEEERVLKKVVRESQEELGRPLHRSDLKRIRIPGRSEHAIRNKAYRLGLCQTIRKIGRWNRRELDILVVLAQKRRLGARGIKQRGFFAGHGGRTLSWQERSVDSIAQQIRRRRLVDPARSFRARHAKRLSADEKRKLRIELTRNPDLKTTAEIGRDYGLSASTIRRYRARWGIKYTWHDAMALPASVEKRVGQRESRQQRSLVQWRKKKRALLTRLRRARDRAIEQARKDGKSLRCRVCARCGERWPATRRFFAASPKRSGGKVVKNYLRRACRVCPRHKNSSESSRGE